MKKLLASLLATASIATTSAFAQLPLPFDNISQFDLAMEYNFVAQCSANGEVRTTASSQRGFVDTFTITAKDLHSGIAQKVYLVGDLDFGIFALVLADRDTGDLIELLDMADPTVFIDALEGNEGQATRFVFSETLIFIQTFYTSSFIVDIDGYSLYLDASMQLRARAEPSGEYFPPKVKLISKALHGEGVESEIEAEPEDDDFFIVTSGSVLASGVLNLFSELVEPERNPLDR